MALVLAPFFHCLRGPSILIRSVIVGLVGVVLAIAAVSDVQAQSLVPASDPCAAPSQRTDVRPDPDGPPTEISMGVILTDVLSISDVDQTISLDLSMVMSWTDPRLAPLEGCRMSLDDVWYPVLSLRNSGRMFQRLPKVVSITEGGRVVYHQRIAGTFASYHTLNGFPFDRKEIALSVFPANWSDETVVLKIDEDFTGIAPKLNISDWRILGFTTEADEKEIEELGVARSVLTATISAERYVAYYIWKVIIPIALIIMMSWSVFWIGAEQMSTKLGLSATSVLTMVAFIFATTNLLPRLGYFTVLDRYIAVTTAFVFLALMETLITSFLAVKERDAQAARINLISRFLFPAAFALACFVIFRDVL